MTRKGKRFAIYTTAVVAILIAIVIGGSLYMLSYSLTPERKPYDADTAYEQLYERFPDMRQWVDSLKATNQLRDTFLTFDGGRRAHALYLRCDSAHGRTAIMVHGYTDCAVKFLYIGRMYQRDLDCNILMPDLYAHGQSDGDAIQMGWKDRLDVIRWTAAAHDIFSNGEDSLRIVVHGVSMGAATTMCVSGETLPDYIKCFVEDCGYTSVWNEFEGQLDEQFGLPAFPLLYTTSALCKLRYGWSFGEASPLNQVKKCTRPMLFIHGDDDSFVPSDMVYPLYEAKSEPKQLWIAKGSKHAMAYTDHPEEYTATVSAFLDKYLH